MFDSFAARQSMTRRTACRGALAALAALPVVIEPARAQALPHLSEQDPQAKALGYLENAKKVDAKANPTYKPDQTCANCLLLQGKTGDAYRPCNLFPGKLVASAGWCKAWVKKP